MFTGGNATLFVKDFEGAVRFYTETLGLKLRFRADNHWAEVVVGDSLLLGIHPVGPKTPGPGLAGSIQLGLNVGESLDDVMKTLSGRGVAFDGEIVEDDGVGRFAYLKDPEGNAIYLWESAVVPGPPAGQKN